MPVLSRSGPQRVFPGDLWDLGPEATPKTAGHSYRRLAYQTTSIRYQRYKEKCLETPVPLNGKGEGALDGHEDSVLIDEDIAYTLRPWIPWLLLQHLWYQCYRLALGRAGKRFPERNLNGTGHRVMLSGQL